MVLIAHIADVHLGYAQYGLREREDDIYQAFEEAIELMKKEHIKILLISGDLFDSPKPPIKALMNARKQLLALKKMGTEIFHVLGDHELPRRLSELPPTAILENISKHVGLKNAEIKSENIAVTGLDRTPPSSMKNALKKLRKLAAEADAVSKKKILLAHVPAYRPEIGFESLPTGYSYYALGHEHERKILSKNGAAAAYPGSIEILSIIEINSWMKNGKGFLLIDFSEDEPIIQEINLESIRPQKLIEVDAKELEEALQEIVEWSSKEKKKPIVHFRIKGKAMDRGYIFRKIQNKLSGRVLYHRHEIIEEEEELELEKAPSLDLRSMIREYMSMKGFKEEEIEFAVSIYESFISGGAEEMERIILRRAEEAEKK
ncbi:MAG: DNA repair exonuclease [Thaumarchaeota archaeon]|nr:DNA repair exonuclease [Nitrososphaerota archaeon]